MSDDPECNKCGHPRSAHGEDPRTGRLTKCPAYRQEDRRPPSHRSHR